jgi:hypothetical protein
MPRSNPYSSYPSLVAPSNIKHQLRRQLLQIFDLYPYVSHLTHLILYSHPIPLPSPSPFSPFKSNRNHEPSHSSRLPFLPDELLIEILANVHWPKALWSLRFVCRRIYWMVEPLLYSSVLLRSTNKYASFSGSLSKHPERALHVHALKLHFANERLSEPSLVIPTVNLMSNLQELSIDAMYARNDSLDEIFGRAVRLSLFSNHLTFLTKCSSTLTIRISSSLFC